MATPETAYKGRCKEYLKALAKRASLVYHLTALGFGAKSGLPDQWHQFGHVAVFFENKRKGKSARKLQEHRMKQLRAAGFISFCLAANPDSTGAKGQERQELIRELLSHLQDNDVLTRAEQYVEDCYTLKTQLEKELI